MLAQAASTASASILAPCCIVELDGSAPGEKFSAESREVGTVNERKLKQNRLSGVM